MAKEKKFKKVVKYSEEYPMLIFFIILLLVGYVAGVSFTEQFEVWHLAFPLIMAILWFIGWVCLREVYWREIK